MLPIVWTDRTTDKGVAVSQRVTKRASVIRRRRTFAATTFGLSADKTVSRLKAYLYAAGLAPSPDAKLDLVMVEDFDHFTELIAEHGIPLARSDAHVETVVQHVTVPRKRYLALLILAVVIEPLSVAHDLVDWLT